MRLLFTARSDRHTFAFEPAPPAEGQGNLPPTEGGVLALALLALGAVAVLFFLPALLAVELGTATVTFFGDVQLRQLVVGMLYDAGAEANRAEGAFAVTIIAGSFRTLSDE